MLRDYTRKDGIPLFAQGDARRGMVHVVAPELAIALPGMTLVLGSMAVKRGGEAEGKTERKNLWK